MNRQRFQLQPRPAAHAAAGVARVRRQHAACPARSAHGGFTLLEVIFAMLMVAIIVPLLLGSLTGDYKLRNKALQTTEPPRMAAQALDWLRQDLGDAVPPPPTTVTTTLIGPFEGSSGSDDKGHPDDDLVFFTNADSPQHADSNGEIKMVELNVITAPNGDHVLVRKVTRDLVSYINGNPPDPDVEVLCRGVSGFTLSYFDGTNWTDDTWDSTAEDNTLPAAVRVTLSIDRPDGSTYHCTSVIPLSCSTAQFDSTVNTGTVQ